MTPSIVLGPVHRAVLRIGLATVAALALLHVSPPAGSQEPLATTTRQSVQGLKLKVSKNGRTFVDQHDRPFFYLGDTCWLLFQRLNREETDEYLKDRAEKGFTVIQAYLLRGLDKRHPDGPTSLLGEPPLLDRDPTKPNPAYFKHVDEVVDRANRLGFVMALVVSKSWHVNDHPERVFDVKNAYTFGKFLGERYKNNAVLWYVGGDSRPANDGEIWVSMAKGLKAGGEGSHLVSYHGSGGTSSSMWYHKEDWLDFNSIQSGHGWAAKTYRFITVDRELSPAKPTVDMEPPYENHPTGSRTPRIDSHQVRKGAYWAMLAGAAGHGYGALDLFHLYKDGDGPFPRNGFQPWRKAIAYEGSRQVGFMRRLFELRPWHKLVPDQSVLASGEGEAEDHVRAARDEEGGFAVVYIPTGKPVSIHMEKLSGKTIQAHWYDPRAGTLQAAGEFPKSGSPQFVPPTRGDKNDWVLVLDDAAKSRPAGSLKRLRRIGTAQPRNRTIDYRMKPADALERVEKSLDELEMLVHKAGEAGCDVLAFPEDTLGLGKWAAAHEKDEKKQVLPRAVPRMLERLGMAAAKHHMYLVCCNDDLDADGNSRNTAFFLDRDGKEAGRYHKVQPVIHESSKQGDSFPVFPTPDLGGVGMLICYDMVFPEAPRCLALGGADIIFHPTLGGAAIGDNDISRAAFRTRAVDNFVYVVVSQRGGGSMIISPQGKILVEGQGPDDIAIADIDPFGGREGGDAFNHQRDMRARLFRERNPKAYSILTEPDPPVLKKIPATLSRDDAIRIAGKAFTVGEDEFKAAESLERAGKTEEAVAAYEKLRTAYPATWIDRVARERIASLVREAPAKPTPANGGGVRVPH